MTISYDVSHRGWSQGSAHGGVCLGDKFEILKEIGDGSFGSVALARVRTAGAHVARRGTLVAIKTMKKTFESFAPCLELREIIFLRSLPNHPHLVPALDIFLDPLSKKLHIAMEYMDGNLYQLMKARDHKTFDGSSVKSILYQILSGLEHIHHNKFFHRDIKPENILVSVSGREDVGSAFKRYSQLVTPPSTPPSYSVKIADFGLARETHSRLPYTTYVSTRWYRAPEVLLRAGEYSAPVDIWAIGAMAVEVAMLKPLFPGSNEVDQVWRVCEIMGSPGNWVNKQGQKVGGGTWKDGVKLAQKLGFSFPKMAPHAMETILPSTQWPSSMCSFVTSCLMWDPNHRPTAAECLNHEYFFDAQDPLRPKSSGSRLLGRKQSEIQNLTNHQSADGTTSLSSKTSSWFRKSLVARESAPSVPQHVPTAQTISPRQSPVKPTVPETAPESKPRPVPAKRSTWTHGTSLQGAPMPILPSIRPVSPMSNTVTAQAHVPVAASEEAAAEPKASGKIGRQLSMASHGNHYSDVHRMEAERALNGQSGPASPPNGQRESFFSHLRKRARRLSGRHQLPISPRDEDSGVQNSSTALYGPVPDSDPSTNPEFAELDRALKNVRYSLDTTAEQGSRKTSAPVKPPERTSSNPMLKRHSSQPFNQAGRISPSPTSTWNRRGNSRPMLPKDQYETLDEQEELLDEALAGARAAVARLDQQHQHQPQNQHQHQHQHQQQQQQHKPAGLNFDMAPDTVVDAPVHVPYPTPSPSGRRSHAGFDSAEFAKKSQPIDIQQKRSEPQNVTAYPFPTPPYDENEWAAAAAASIFAASDQWR